ncbi:MAG: SGNH/GDSL hydrolase family protein [Anaerolineae bacterium]
MDRFFSLVRRSTWIVLLLLASGIVYAQDAESTPIPSTPVFPHIVTGTAIPLVLTPMPSDAQPAVTEPEIVTPPPYYLPLKTVEHIRQIYRLGEQRGNRAGVFSRVGDSISVSYNFLTYFGYDQYSLGRYDYLQTVIDYFGRTNARDGNSFLNPSLAARVGWTAFGVLEPDNADAALCATGETPLVCEYRLVRPSIALIMFGTNDVGYVDPAAYRYNLSRIVDISEQMGVIPVLSSFPPRPGYETRVSEFNRIVQETAADHYIPFLDYYAALTELPNFGLSEDGIHPSAPPEEEATATNFRPPYLQYGYNVRNLTALEMLYTLWWHLHTL